MKQTLEAKEGFLAVNNDSMLRTIMVERESQKPIVVGKNGDMIKKIGTAAREELEKFFATKVFLDLHVRVKGDWRDDERMLGELGVGHRRE